MKKIIIGFTWEMACGKDTATDYIFKKFGWKKFKFSQVLRDVLARIFVDPTRENLQALSTVLRENFGQDLLARIMKEDVEKSNEKVLLIDWVRRQDDITYLTQLPEFKLIYIETNLENRFSRISVRWENADDIGKTLEQFKKEQEFEAEAQIRWLKNIADYVIDNNWSFEDLYSQIDKILNELN